MAAPAPPSSTAIGVLTLTPSVPAATSSFDTLPSSTASTSMVALSVSISAMMSPGLIACPSVTSHLASLPSSIVGESAGIRISVGIWFCLVLMLAPRVAALAPVRRFYGFGQGAGRVAGMFGGGGLHEHVGPQLARVRLRIGLGEFRCAVDDGADLGI